ncbi:MAG TPA: hypothetical protein PK307_18320, partial [Spirochaetota bacterium]|nr:hypothetical protein [Spirochaetota bacterium]
MQTQASITDHSMRVKGQQSGCAAGLLPVVSGCRESIDFVTFLFMISVRQNNLEIAIYFMENFAGEGHLLYSKDAHPPVWPVSCP